MAVSKFQANWSRRSTYVCRICSQNTRETGLGEQGVELCALCYDLAGFENSMNDDGLVEAQQFKDRVLKLIGKVEARGRGDAGWRSVFSKLIGA